MKKFSWICALILALTMAFVFVGCKDADTDEPTPQPGPVNPTPTPGGDYTPNPAAQDFTVAFSVSGTGGGTATAKTTKILKDGDNNGTIDPGTLEYITGGYKYTYGTGNNTNYGNSVLRFKIDLGDFVLADYGKISFDWQATAPQYNNGNSVNSNKRLYLYATDIEDDIVPYVENKDLIVSNIVRTATWYDGSQGDAGVPLVNGLGVHHVEMPINYEERLEGLGDGNPVWFAIYVHAEGGTYQITNLKFWAGAQTITPTEPGASAPPQPPTIADVPEDFVELALDLNSFTAGNTAVAPDVPSTDVTFASDKLTVNFTAYNQRVSFKLTEAQIAAFTARGNNDVYVNIDATVKSGTGDSFRYLVGDAAAESGWNLTASLDNFTLADIAVATEGKGIKLNANGSGAAKDFILQHRSGDAVTIEISSITIYVAPVPKAPAKTLVFAEGDVTGNNVNITLLEGGKGYHVVTTAGYDWAWACFKVKFDEGYKLSDYSKIDYKIKGITNATPPADSGDLSGYKAGYILVYANKEDVATNAALPNTNLIFTETAGGSATGIADLDTESSRTVTIKSADALPAGTDLNEVWIFIRCGGSYDYIYEVWDIKFY